MTDTQSTHDKLVISNRDWVGPVLRLELQASHEFLTACSDEELQAIAALQTVGADKRGKLATLKPIYNAVHERNMVRDPVVVATPTPDPADPAGDEPAAEKTDKPTRRTVKPGS